jgi:hypothetical protein
MGGIEGFFIFSKENLMVVNPLGTQPHNSRTVTYWHGTSQMPSNIGNNWLSLTLWTIEGPSLLATLLI